MEQQLALFCKCGATRILACGRCASCYWRHARSIRCFGGLREKALDRDRWCCTNCGAWQRIVVHHRIPGVNALRLLATLCPRCHARIHRLARAFFGMSPSLYQLWRELHRNQAQQLELPFPESIRTCSEKLTGELRSAWTATSRMDF
jgi:hypothetical protein